MTDHCNVCAHIVQFWSVIKTEKQTNKTTTMKTRMRSRLILMTRY